MRILPIFLLTGLLAACDEEKPETATPFDSDTGPVDADGDGFPQGVDCEDGNPLINPEAREICNDLVDNDCNGLVDGEDPACASTEDTGGSPEDADTDGYTRNVDCDDEDPLIHPGADEYCGDGVDNDCDEEIDEDDAVDALIWYQDADGDGYGAEHETAPSCEQPNGYVGLVTDDEHQPLWDCNDSTAAANPATSEVCDGLDNNCDGESDEPQALDAGIWYRDADGDGFGDENATLTACSCPAGYLGLVGDCDDSRADVHPDAAEICNAVDDDCDGTIDEDDAEDAPTWYRDADVDGYGDTHRSTPSCAQPSGYVADDSDCDDGKININPMATEYCNTFDDDCDGTVDEDDAADAPIWYHDADVDGYGDLNTTTVACSQPSGYVGYFVYWDCDDSNAAINPGAGEYCNNIDDNCTGTIDEDGIDSTAYYRDDDGDGFGSADDTNPMTGCSPPAGRVADNTDCDDSDAQVSPGAEEVCDAVDNDCDGTVDEPSTEVCFDGVDSDCDGLDSNGCTWVGLAELSTSALGSGGSVSLSDTLYLPTEAGQVVAFLAPHTFVEDTTSLTCGWQTNFTEDTVGRSVTADIDVTDCGSDSIGEGFGAYLVVLATVDDGGDGTRVESEALTSTGNGVDSAAWAFDDEGAADSLAFCGLHDVDPAGDVDLSWSCEAALTAGTLDVTLRQQGCDGGACLTGAQGVGLALSTNLVADLQPFECLPGDVLVLTHTLETSLGSDHVALVLPSDYDSSAGDLLSLVSSCSSTSTETTCVLSCSGTGDHVGGDVLFLDGDLD